MSLANLSKRTYFSVTIFLFGLALTIAAIQFSAVQLFITKMSDSGAIGAFIAGILYAFAFTSSLATTVFLNMSDQLHPILTALIGGIGAALYDITVFVFVRRQTEKGFLQVAFEAMKGRRHIPRWISLIIGVLILGSPLPDELAAGFLGFMKFSTTSFIIISFVANTLGLYLILLLTVV